MDLAAAVPPRLTLTWAATCCAAEPGLDGLLLFDLPPAALPSVAAALSQALADADPAAGLPRLVRLGSYEDEDDLWSTLRPQDVDGITMLMPAPGPLVRRDDGLTVVVVPDLARLSLPASRAAVVMLGSPTTELQRHGLSRRWRTGTYWVAACATADVGQVSLHLLDRFAVRLPASALVPTVDPAQRIMRTLAGAPEQPQVPVPAPPPAWRAVLRRGGAKPAVDDGAIERAIALHDARHGMRRPLALLRLARATAWLTGDRVVTAGHVDIAAELTRMIIPAPAPRPTAAAPEPAVASEPVEHPPPDDGDRRAAHTAPDQTPAGPAPAAGVADEPVLAAAPAQTLPTITVTATATVPYPEVDADPDREAESLKLPWQRAASRPADRGPVIGTTPARSLEDLAWLDSVRHAALYQHFRLRSAPAAPGARLVMTGADLRAYRRAAQPERMLVLVLDHTCRHGWEWLPALAPYLRHAYSDRAAICLVEVGGDGAPSLLRAERSMLRSLLDPRVQAALSRKPGGSTPLAHGLDLAGQALRHALQHGAAALTEAEVVVVTDGLGNVPLDASLRDQLTGPVGGTGVDDAIEAAQALRAFDGVRAVVVQPPRVPHPEILLRLVDAISDERALAVAGGP